MLRLEIQNESNLKDFENFIESMAQKKEVGNLEGDDENSDSSCEDIPVQNKRAKKIRPIPKAKTSSGTVVESMRNTKQMSIRSKNWVLQNG